MRSLRRLRTLVIAAGLLAAASAPAAAAPTWLPAKDLSVAPPSGFPSNSSVASDAVGETFATWIRPDGTDVRVQLAAHAPGQPWSAPADISAAGQSAGPPSLALSSTGYGAIAWARSDGTKLRVQVARRAPGAGFGAADTITSGAEDAIDPVVAVDPAGDVVVAWTDGIKSAIHARRYSAGSGWGSTDDLEINGTSNLNGSLTLAISPSGVATAAWVFDTDNTLGIHYEVRSRSQAPGGSWTPVAQLSSTVAPVQAGAPELAIDGAGTVTLVWFEYNVVSCTGTCKMYASGVVHAATRPETSGVWQGATTLSDPNLISDSPQVATTPAGEVTVAWTEQVAQAIKVVTRPVGGSFPDAASATIIVPQDKQISSSGANAFPTTSLRIATGPTGTVVAFARSEDGNALAEAVFRPAGGSWPNPATTAPTVLSAPGTGVGTTDGPSLTFDGLGNAVLSWTRDTLIQAAAFDDAPPAFTAISVPATGTTGQPVALSATTLDTWSPLATGQPSWNFGDNNLGAGPTVTHVYAAPGTYTVTIGASDAIGNTAVSATRQIVISSSTGPPPPTLLATSVAKPKVRALYKVSRLVGTISLHGTSPIRVSLKIAIRKRGAKKDASSSTFLAAAGTWKRTLKLPTGLAPGIYIVTVSGKGVRSSQTSFSIVAPKSGIVTRAYATGPKRGPAATTITGTSGLWAHFVFGTLPKKSQTITTQWILPSGSRLAANTRPRTSLVEAQVKDLSGKALPTGRWRCIVKAGKTVVAILNVRLR